MVSQPSSRHFPGFDKVYQLHDPQKRGAFVATMALKREEAHGLLRGTLRPQVPVEVQWFMGRAKLNDFIWPSTVGPKIVSQRVIDALTAEEVTGWSTYPVTVSNRDGTIEDGYVGLSITGRCGSIRGDLSIREPKQFPGGVFDVYSGLFFDSELWDGSDLFLSNDGRLFVFAMQKVRDLFQRARVTGVALEPVHSVIMATRPGD